MDAGLTRARAAGQGPDRSGVRVEGTDGISPRVRRNRNTPPTRPHHKNHRQRSGTW